MYDRDKTEEVLDVDLEGIRFIDLFSIEELQRYQDLFADTHEVASVITLPDGTPITNPSHFTRLCKDIICKTDQGSKNCFLSDATMDSNFPNGFYIKPCNCCGLLNAGVSITVAGKHIANWHIGQVLNNDLNDIPNMSFEKFNKVAQLLFSYANELSTKTELKLKLQISEQELVKTQKTVHKLKESETKFWKVFQTSSDSINICLRDGTYIDVNEEFTKLTGYTPEDVVGKTTTEINIWAIPEDLEKLIKGLREKGFIKNLESKFRCKDGSIKTAILTTEIFILNDEPHILTIAHDITERKQMEELLQESKKQYENLVSNIPVGVYILRTTPETTFTLDYVSPKMAEMIDLSVEDLLASGEAIFKAIHPDDLDGFVRLNMDGIIQKRPFDWKGRLVIKGDVKWMHFRSRPQELENGDTLWHGLIIDITERMLAEAEIRYQNKELVKLNDEKDKFFSIIAHDLRSPFNSFLGFTKIMAEELQSLTMAQIQEIAVKMSKSATNLYRLLENLLEWSQISNGALSFNPEIIKLNSVVGGCIEMISESAKNKEIEIENNINEGLEVFADRNMMQTIIRNLISNALKFTSKGGQINISTKPYSKQWIEVAIQDSGIGMNQLLIENIFRIDKKTNRLGTENEPSSGLGLLLCKELVEKQGGKIRVESEVGRGSTFSFSIPLA